MRASKLLLWLVVSVAVPMSCLVKGWLSDSNNRHFVAVIADFRAILDRQMPDAEGPRVLIAGGSNAVSSYDSAEIARKTGLPVYNLGVVSEGLDVRNMFDVVEARARSGDIVVLSALSLLSYRDQWQHARSEQFASGTWRIPTNAVELPLPGDMGALSFLPLFDTATLIRSLASYRDWRALAAAADGQDRQDRGQALPMFRLAGLRPLKFDARGDWVDCTASTSPKPLVFDARLLERSRPFVAYATHFADRLQQRGVSVHFALPTVLIRERDRARWEAQIPGVIQQFPGVAFLDSDRGWQLNSDTGAFCDTNAHLLRSNAVRNSEAIIAAVRSDIGGRARLASR